MANVRVVVTQQSNSGRNEKFFDRYKKRKMTRAEFVRRILRGEYPNYHVRKSYGLKTPESNPDAKRNNNLG